jgi:nicotinate (nicotinamide) nucleotide adenylyltransferase
MAGSAELKRVGLLGAAFDPPHFGHLLLAQLALETGDLDEIWLMPCPDRWDKKPVATGQQRSRWLEQMLSHCPPQLRSQLRINQFELNQSVYRGTHWLVTQLRGMNPANTFSLILGWDSFVSVPAWRDPSTGTMNGNALLESTHCFVSPRATASIASVPHPEHHQGGVSILPALDSIDPQSIGWMEGVGPIQVSALSSSLVRAAVAEKKVLQFNFADVQEAIVKSGAYSSSV